MILLYLFSQCRDLRRTNRKNMEELPKYIFRHKTPIQLRFSDVDLFGHVNNTVFFSLYDLAKAEYFKAVLNDMPMKFGVSAVVANINADFIHPVHFDDDIVIEYRLTKRDNMFLKLYKYNTQESILEDEVVETGVGYVVRKKMNSLWELFKSTKSPESKQERKRKRNQKEYLKRNDEIAPSINSVKSDSNLNVEGETENLK